MHDTPPSRRRAIMVLSPTAMQRIRSEPEGMILQRTEGLRLTSIDHDPVDEGLCVRDGFFAAGHLYLLSPFDTRTYVDASGAHEAFALERQHHFLRLCQALGATSLEVVDVRSIATEAEQKVGVGVEKGVAVKGSVETKRAEQLVRTLRTKHTFPGGAPDLVRAQELLDQTALSTDLEFTALLDLRRGRNPLRSHELDLTVTRSGRQQLKLAASVKVPAYAKLTMDYTTALKQREECQTRLRLRFDAD